MYPDDIRSLWKTAEMKPESQVANKAVLISPTITQITPAMFVTHAYKQFLSTKQMSWSESESIWWQTVYVVLRKVAVSLYPLGRNHRSKFLIVAASWVISSGVQSEIDFSQLRIHHMFFPLSSCWCDFFYIPLHQSHVLVWKYWSIHTTTDGLLVLLNMLNQYILLNSGAFSWEYHQMSCSLWQSIYSLYSLWFTFTTFPGTMMPSLLGTTYQQVNHTMGFEFEWGIW